jgi:hypothetical protein
MSKNIYAENITDVLITITLEIWEEQVQVASSRGSSINETDETTKIC